jgi:hypothetical protein
MGKDLQTEEQGQKTGLNFRFEIRCNWETTDKEVSSQVLNVFLNSI